MIFRQECPQDMVEKVKMLNLMATLKLCKVPICAVLEVDLFDLVFRIANKLRFRKGSCLPQINVALLMQCL